MHIAIVHGYLLEGTGSNYYVQNLCREFCKMGQDITLICQENYPENYEFISKVMEFYPDNQNYQITLEKNTPYQGECYLYRPHLEGFLPVYVHDYYEGYHTVKEFTDAKAEEIEFYLHKNKTAMSEIYKETSPDLIISNHLIMQPVYTEKCLLELGSKIPHINVVHGSAFNFSVRLSNLITNYALWAMKKTDALIQVSEYARQELLEFFDGAEWINRKCHVVPAGVDVEKFSPVKKDESKSERIENVLDWITENQKSYPARSIIDKQSLIRETDASKSTEETIRAIKNDSTNVSSVATDEGANNSLSSINWNTDHVILCLGKYLWTKGPQILIAAAPLIFRKHPNTRILVTGSGKYRSYLEALVAAQSLPKPQLYRELLLKPYLLTRKQPSDNKGYTVIKGLLENLEDYNFSNDYFEAATQFSKERIIFTGYIGHEGLKNLIPACDVQVNLSIFPESFGMVAIEALASGTIPVITNYTAFKELLEVYTEHLPESFDIDKEQLLSLVPDEQLTLNTADTINMVLEKQKQLTPKERRELSCWCHNFVRDRYSWQVVSNNLIDLYLSLNVHN